MTKRKDRPGVDRSGRTPLHYAACDNLESEVIRLVNEGADVNARDDAGWTPLHFAAQSKAARIAEILLNHGAQVNAMDANGNTPLSNAVFGYIGNGETIIVLRRFGADPTLKNSYGVSALELALDSYSEATRDCPVSRFFDDLNSPATSSV